METEASREFAKRIIKIVKEQDQEIKELKQRLQELKGKGGEQ